MIRNSMLFLLLSITILQHFTVKPTISPDIIAKDVALKNVKSLHVPDGRGLCSSVFVNYKNRVRHVTNSHCCQQPVAYKGKMVSIERDDPATDLCEISHNDMPKEGIQPASNEAQIGDRIYIAGFPVGGHHFSLSTGFVTTIVDYNIMLARPIILTNAFATFGNSGGGVISTEGELVGITSISNLTFHTGGYIPIKILKKFLN